jgi:hypothetical protein
MANYDSKKDFTDEDEVQQKSDDTNLIEKLGIEAEDLHGA